MTVRSESDKFIKTNALSKYGGKIETMLNQELFWISSPSVAVSGIEFANGLNFVTRPVNNQKTAGQNIVNQSENGYG